MQEQPDIVASTSTEADQPGNGLSVPPVQASTDGTTNADEEEQLIRTLVSRGHDTTPELSLTREQEQELAQRVIRDFEDAIASMSEFRDNHEKFWKNWRGVLSPKTFPFEGAANVRVPISVSFKEQMQARLYKGLFGGDKLAMFSSIDGRLKQDELDEISDWFKFELDEIVKLKLVMADVLHEILIDGISLPVASWDTHERSMLSTWDVELESGTPLTEQMLQAVQTIFSDEDPVPRATGVGVFEVIHTPRGNTKRTAKVSFSIQDSTRLVADVERVETLFDGVRIDRIAIPDDLVVVNTSTSVEDLPFFGSRLQLLVRDFLAGVGTKYRDFTSKELEEILANSSNREGTDFQQERSRDTDLIEGTQSEDTTGIDYSRRWMEIYRWEGWYAPEPTAHSLDVEKFVEAKQVPVAVWLDRRSQRIIRIKRLEELNKDGKRTPVKFDFIPQPDRFFSVGLMELIQHVQTEIDGIHNQSLDAGLLSNIPWGLYEPTAGTPANTIFDLKPGKLYPTRNAQSVTFPRTQFNPLWNLQMEGSLTKWAQQMAGLGDPSMGSFVSKRTSASEFNTTAASLDMRTELILDRIIDSVRTLLYRIFGLYQQFAKDGRVYQVTGEKGEKIVRQLKRDRLHGKLLLHLTSNIQQLNAQLQRDVAVNMLSLLLNESLIQLGITKPDTIYEAVKRVCRMNDYHGVPIHKPDMPPESDPPEIEHKRMMMGEPVQPSLSENFGEHLQAHIALASSPYIMQYMSSEQARQLLAQHIVQTQKMQHTAQIMKQQQAAMSAQMQTNMAEQGVRPGLAGGSQAGDQAEPGTPEEGVQGGEGE